MKLTHIHGSLDIKFSRNLFVEFNIFEHGISQFLEQYQNKILNEAEPFDSMMPTLENVTDYFAEEFFIGNTEKTSCKLTAKGV